MKLINIKSLTVLAAALGLGSIANATPTPIAGTIDFSGTSLINTTTISFPTISGITSTGDFSAIPTDSYTANINSYGLYTDAATSVPPAGGILWTVADATTGISYAFDISTISLEFNGGNSWTWGGSGVFTVAGTSALTSNTGTWTITSSTQGANNFSFESSNGTTVPDSGATALLLALGVVAIAAYAAKSKLVKA